MCNCASSQSDVRLFVGEDLFEQIARTVVAHFDGGLDGVVEPGHGSHFQGQVVFDLLFHRRADFQREQLVHDGRAIEQQDPLDERLGMLHFVDGFFLGVIAEPFVTPVVAHLGVQEVLIDGGQLRLQHFVQVGKHLLVSAHAGASSRVDLHSSKLDDRHRPRGASITGRVRRLLHNKVMNWPRLPRWWFVAALCAVAAHAQVIEFESGGLKYQTMTKAGVTVMFAHLPANLRDYAILQVAISNGSEMMQSVRPEDFIIQRGEDSGLRATGAEAVVAGFLAKAGRNDVIKLVTAYEIGLYGMERFHSPSGYEQRRQAALAEVSSAKLKAAAAASAIVLVPTRLRPGQSIDGAVFFRTVAKTLGPAKLRAKVGQNDFEFKIEAATP